MLADKKANPTGRCLQTERSKLAASLVTAARRAILLSGTPALNRPKELFTQVLQPALQSLMHAACVWCITTPTAHRVIMGRANIHDEFLC